MSDETALQTTENGQPPVNIDRVENALLKGDLSKLSAKERKNYYREVCTSVGLNPLTKPFEYIRLNGKLTLYAKRDAAEQLRKINGVSIIDMRSQQQNGLYMVRVKAQDGEGRTDMATGAVNMKGLRGDKLANAIMKAETKAKRRVTLSICGLGWLDETELETIPSAQDVEVDHETGKIEGSSSPPRQGPPQQGSASDYRSKIKSYSTQVYEAASDKEAAAIEEEATKAAKDWPENAVKALGNMIARANNKRKKEAQESTSEPREKPKYPPKALQDTMPYGQYEGTSIEDVIEEDPEYLQFLIDEKGFNVTPEVQAAIESAMDDTLVDGGSNVPEGEQMEMPEEFRDDELPY